MLEPSFKNSLKIQLRVIGALILREVITRYGRHGLGMLWLVLEPMLFTLGVTALWYAAKLHSVSEIPIVAFALTGYSSILIWRNSVNRCAKAIEPNLSLMYHRNVKVQDIFIARILLECTGAAGSFALLTIIYIFIGAIAWPNDFALIVYGYLMLCWFALSLGFIVGALTERSEAFDRTWHIISYLLFPLSGAAFMVDWLPEAAQKLILWVPMVHGVEMIRHGFFGDVVKTHENMTYMAICNLVLLFIGLILSRETGRRVQPE